LNGKVYFAENKTFFSINFQNEISIIHEFDENIYELFILNANIYAFQFKQKIVLLKKNQDNKSTILREIEFPTDDFFLGSTKSPRFVHSASNLPIKNFKIITYDEKRNWIKILQFNIESQELELFCEFEINIKRGLYVSPCRINERFLIDNIESHNHQHEIIRFAIITTKDILKVIEAKKNNEYSIVAEIKDTFSLFEYVELDCFFENMIIVKMGKKQYYETVASIYDFGKYFKHFQVCNTK
jgi:hypothetical protein